MRRACCFGLLFCSLLVAAPPGLVGQEVSTDRLMEMVEWLAAPEREGRKPPSDGWAASRDWLAQQFEAVGLEPLGDGYVQAVSYRGREGANVVGVLRGGSPVRGHIILGAHYDHLGIIDGQVYPGADDNAAGVAAMLEVARLVRARRDSLGLQVDIVFIAFDLEEQGLSGSRYYAQNPLLPLDEAEAMICLDILGRSLRDQMPGRLVALGSERSTGLKEELLQATARSGHDGLWRLATEYVGPRSDFLPFALEEIPHVFLTTATHADYHTPNDTADRVDPEVLTLNTRLVLELVQGLATREERTRWTGNQPDPLEEARCVHEMVQHILTHPDSAPDGRYPLTANQRRLGEAVAGFTGQLLERGRVRFWERPILIASAFVLILGVVEDPNLEKMRSRIERFFGLEGDE